MIGKTTVGNTISYIPFYRAGENKIASIYPSNAPQWVNRIKINVSPDPTSQGPFRVRVGIINSKGELAAITQPLELTKGTVVAPQEIIFQIPDTAILTEDISLVTWFDTSTGTYYYYGDHAVPYKFTAYEMNEDFNNPTAAKITADHDMNWDIQAYYEGTPPPPPTEPPPPPIPIPANELRAVLIKRVGDSTHNNELTFQNLAAKGINTAFLQLSATSWTGYQINGFASAIAAAKKYGIKVFVLLPCVSYDPTYTDAYENYGYGLSGANPDWRMVKIDGTPINYCCFNRASTRARVKQVIDIIMSKFPEIEGIVHDYIRMPATSEINETGIETAVCYCNECKAAFQAWLASTGKAPLASWSDAVYGGSRWANFAEWRRIPINEMVAYVKGWATAHRVGMTFSACIWVSMGPYWADPYIETLAQNPNEWVGNIDYVLPMLYRDNVAAVQAGLDNTKKYKTANGAIPIGAFLAIGSSDVGYAPLTLDVWQSMVDTARENGCVGFAIYQYDGIGWTQGETNIQPYLDKLALDPIGGIILLPFCCSICGACFASQAELDAHTASAHPVTPPTPKPTLAARSIGPLGVPSAALHLLWRLRERFIRPEVHRKLHPLV